MHKRLPVRRRLARRVGQLGASAVEFALIFPVMFGLSYGVVVYSYLYVLRQSLHFAAQEAAEAAVSIDPDIAKNPSYDAKVQTAAQAAVDAVINWMPAQVRTNVTKTVTFCSGGGGATACPSDGSDAVIVTLSVPMTGPSQMFAQIALPGIGTFPPLPAIMTAQAVARV